MRNILSKVCYHQSSCECKARSMNEKQNEEKQKTQEQLSVPLSKFLKTNDLGNFENCELNNEVIQSIFDFHPHLYQMK